MLRKQNGITLMEVLAVIILSSLVILLIWTTLMTVIKYNVFETKKIRMQEEANYIITEVQRIHRQCSEYELTINVNEISVENCQGPISNHLISHGYNYSGSIFVKEKIDAKKKNASIPFTLILSDIENDRIEIEITSIISRYKLR